MDGKTWLGLFSLVIAGVQYGPYVWAVHKGKIRPHIFSYYIWFISSGVVAAAQYADKGGPGSWSLAMSALACLAVAAFSARGGADYISRADWLALIVSLASIPLWIVTKNPLSAVLLLTFIDGVAYLPSFRKAWVRPYEDTPLTYIVGWGKHLVSLCALEHYSLTTMLMPTFIVGANSVLIFLLVVRRRGAGPTTR